MGCVDVYYLHNPETQLSDVAKPEFAKRIREAFIFLEQAAAQGKIHITAWPPGTAFARRGKAADAMQLGELAGDRTRSGWRKTQIPICATAIQPGDDGSADAGNQNMKSGIKTVMEAAGELGITLIGSASLLQGQVAQNLPGFVTDALGLANDRERALQFARSAPGITTALVGMSRTAHVEANSTVVTVTPAGIEEFGKLVQRVEGA